MVARASAFVTPSPNGTARTTPPSTVRRGSRSPRAISPPLSSYQATRPQGICGRGDRRPARRWRRGCSWIDDIVGWLLVMAPALNFARARVEQLNGQDPDLALVLLRPADALRNHELRLLRPRCQPPPGASRSPHCTRYHIRSPSPVTLPLEIQIAFRGAPANRRSSTSGLEIGLLEGSCRFRRTTSWSDSPPIGTWPRSPIGLQSVAQDPQRRSSGTQASTSRLASRTGPRRRWDTVGPPMAS